jgi:hypothetical protein
MFSRTRVAAVALAATLVIAACGSDDSDTGAGAGVDTTATEATTADTAAPETTVADTTPDTTEAVTDDTTATSDAPTQDVEADTAAAQAALLVVTDLPEGWSEAATADDASMEIDARLAECVGVDGSEAIAATADFSSPDGSIVVGQSIDVQATERDARLVIAQLTNPEVPECVAAAYAELGAAALSAGAIAEGATIGEITATRLAVGAAGDATQAIRVVIPVTSGETTAQVTVDQVFVRSGRSLATISFEGRLEATPVETIDEITTVAASRLPV